MERKKVHLIANAHIDPIWQWEWEEGAACAISTFRTAVEICEENPDFVFCHNESLLYDWIEKFDPALFARIKALVAQDRWHIMGAWVDQPDCNMPSGESFIRQMRLGKGYFMKKFGKTSTCAINLDPFGHTRGMVQLMKKAGFDHYIICRPDPKEVPMPNDDCFIWKGYDGSEVTVRWTNGYSSSLGKVDTSKIEPTLKEYANADPGIILWGVGDHGGGPSKEDVKIIKRLMQEHTDVELVHSTPDAYFAQREASGKPMQVVEKDLNPFAVGCYTSAHPIKDAHRRLEDMLSYTEKICAHAAQMGLMEYPKEELEQAEYDACLCEFHDVLPGSSMESAEKSAVRTLEHGLEIVSRLRTRAFFLLSASQPKPKPGELPVMAYNAQPYPVTGEFTVEFMLHDQNWEAYQTLPRIYQNGVELPSQVEKEASSLSLDWRKRVCFRATLQPMSITRFDINLEMREQPHLPTCPEDEEAFLFDNGEMEVRISKKTGLITDYKVDGKPCITAPIYPTFVQDNCDPWGMTVDRFDGKETPFRLATKEECERYCACDDGPFSVAHDSKSYSGLEYEALQPVHVIESGAVRTVIEAILTCDGTYIAMRYVLPAKGKYLDIRPHISCAARNQMLKLVIPTPFADSYRGQQPYGSELMPTNGREVCAQRWVLAAGGEGAMSVLTSTYGSDCVNGKIRLSILRSPAYTAHPLGERRMLPGNRMMQRQSQGESDFTYRLQAGAYEERREAVEREAAAYFEQPPVLNFFPGAVGDKPVSLACLSDERITMGTFKRGEDGACWVTRVFNPTEKEIAFTLALPAFGTEYALTLKPYEVRTLRISEDGKNCSETDILA